MEKLLIRFFQTDRSTFALMSRLVLATVMFAHGAQKVFGWFGGDGLEATMAHFTHSGMPTVIAALVVLGESLGSVGIFVGLGTRLGALGTTMTMLGAIFMVHLHNGFFMNWMGTHHGEGFEYHLLALAISTPLMLFGAGRLSVDRWIADRLAHRTHGSHYPHVGVAPAM